MRRSSSSSTPLLLACSANEPRSSSPSPPPASSPVSEATLSKAAIFRLALLSGAVAGFTVDAVLFPLDTLKTRLQLAKQAVSSSTVSNAATAAVKSAPKHPMHWLTSLYAGFGPAVVASAPCAATFFGTYDVVKRFLEERFNNERWAPLCHMLAAAAGDVAACTVRSPFEVVKQRLQSGMYTSAGTAVSNIMHSEGVLGFYRGYGSLVLRELPFDALQFPLYELLKKQFLTRRTTKSGINGRKTLETWESCTCGSIAGGVSAAITTPLDVVKTRLMTQPVDMPKYKGIIHGITTIAAEEGSKALMSGIVPRVLWISLGGAIFFGAYETSKKAFMPLVARSQQSSK